MARRLRIEFPSALYHITSRGNARGAVYFNDEDRRTFLRILSSAIHRFNCLCYAYCLMDNHYHLVVETVDGNLSLGMRHLNGVYTQAFNAKHRRPGHIFQGRYKALLVDKESYFLEVCRYVVLNPVRAGMAGHPAEWQWSSFSATACATVCARDRHEQHDKQPWPEILHSDAVLLRFDADRLNAAQRYEKFIMDGIGRSSLRDELKGRVVLGDDDFVRRLNEYLGDGGMMCEVSRRQRLAMRPSLSELFQPIPGDDRERRNIMIQDAHIKFGYSLRSIADALNLHHSSVSKIVNACIKPPFTT